MDRESLPVGDQVQDTNPNTPFAELEAQKETEAFKRSKSRFPIEAIFVVITTAVAIFNLAADFVLFQDLEVLTKQSLALTQPNDTASLLASYNAFIAADPNNINVVCDVPHFISSGFVELRINIAALRDATLAFFCIAIIPNVAGLIYRIGHLKSLYFQRSRKHREMFHPVKNPIDPINPQSNPLARLNVGDISIAGQIRRQERYSLRGETSGYVLIQLFQDIPQVMIFFLYIAFIQRYRGLNCAQQFSDGVVGTVPFYFSLLSLTSSPALELAIAACFLSIAWNYGTLSFRWIYYISSLEPPWIFGKIFACWFLSTLVFIASFVAPVAILFVAFVGPEYYGFADQTTAIGLSAFAGSFWGIGLLWFLALGGLNPDESIFTALCCCDFFEICYFAFPCLDFIGGTFACGCGCDCGESCCCCCC